MQITIDTKNDSIEELRHVAKLLNNMLGVRGRGNRIYNNIPEDIIHSPLPPNPQQPSTGYVDIFERGTHSQNYSQPVAQPQFTPVEQMVQTETVQEVQPVSAASVGLQQEPTSMFSLFDNESTTSQVAQEPEELKKDEQIQIIQY